MFNLFPILAVIIAYFLGNISPAIIIGKLSGIDIRSKGSGNAGTTNVLRVLGKKAAVVTLIIDILKGVVAVLVGRYLGGENTAMICGVAVFIGHIWPLTFGFRGGKGIATILGVLLAIEPLLGIIEVAIVLLFIVLFKMVSLGAVIGAIALPFIAYQFDPIYIRWAIPMAIIILIKHRSNIKRLVKGEESKVSFRKQEEIK
ncbi:MAG: glycerol-3-phosphate 1-O-acyltransferase PlsY [Anaerovoracaceae bacterium]|jgi:glycerol-3-phosphate acyltransferase PlsY